MYYISKCKKKKEKKTIGQDLRQCYSSSDALVHEKYGHKKVNSLLMPSVLSQSNMVISNKKKGPSPCKRLTAHDLQ